jgi:hypothetical protein
MYLFLYELCVYVMDSSYNACIHNDRISISMHVPMTEATPRDSWSCARLRYRESHEDGIKLPGISLVSVSLLLTIQFINNINHATGISIPR